MVHIWREISGCIKLPGLNRSNIRMGNTLTYCHTYPLPLYKKDMNINAYECTYMNVDIDLDTNIIYKRTYTLNMYRCKHQRCFFRRHISCDWSQLQSHVFVDHPQLEL